MTTVAEYRKAYPSPIQWDGINKINKTIDEKLFILYCLFRDIRVYIKTGNVDMPKMQELFKCALLYRETAINTIVTSMQSEFAANELVTEMNSDNIQIADLTDQFFNTRILTITQICTGITNSIIHTKTHRDCVAEILNMYKLGNEMMYYFNLSYQVNAKEYVIIEHIACALFFKEKIAACHGINNPFICYYMQTTPLAKWLLNAMYFIDEANIPFGCIPCLAEPMRKAVR
jgi:hypothetical protein